MNLFKTVKLNWYQVGAVKLASLAGGIALATTWPDVFAPLKMIAWIILVVAGLYALSVWWKQ